MADARFQMLTVFPEPEKDTRCVVWRFLSANNRTVAQSPNCFATHAECLRFLRELRSKLLRAALLSIRDERGHWTWRLHEDGVDLAASSRAYPRRIRAHETAESFRLLAAKAGDVDMSPVVASNGPLIEGC
jgi:uncharacterized protein YegP (UPF0339 family)